MRLDIENDADTRACVVHLEGDVDVSAVPEVRDALGSTIDAGCLNVVLDLEKVGYVDSTALGLLVWIDHHLTPLGGRLIVTGANREVSRILELSGLIGLAPSIATRDSVAEALSGLQPMLPIGEVRVLETMHIPAEVEALGETRQRVVELLAPEGVPEGALFDIKVAVGEALANAVRHGSPSGPDSRIIVEVGMAEDNAVVRIRDTGCGYDGSAGDVEDVYAVSGRGVMFMRALMDAVEFTSCEDGGTTVTLSKRISRSGKQ